MGNALLDLAFDPTRFQPYRSLYVDLANYFEQRQEPLSAEETEHLLRLVDSVTDGYATHNSSVPRARVPSTPLPLLKTTSILNRQRARRCVQAPIAAPSANRAEMPLLPTHPSQQNSRELSAARPAGSKRSKVVIYSARFDEDYDDSAVPERPIQIAEDQMPLQLAPMTAEENVLAAPHARSKEQQWLWSLARKLEQQQSEPAGEHRIEERRPESPGQRAKQETVGLDSQTQAQLQQPAVGRQHDGPPAESVGSGDKPAPLSFTFALPKPANAPPAPPNEPPPSATAAPPAFSFAKPMSSAAPSAAPPATAQQAPTRSLSQEKPVAAPAPFRFSTTSSALSAHGATVSAHAMHAPAPAIGTQEILHARSLDFSMAAPLTAAPLQFGAGSVSMQEPTAFGTPAGQSIGAEPRKIAQPLLRRKK